MKKWLVFMQMKFCFMWKMVLTGYMSNFKDNFILLKFHFIHLIAHLLVGMLVLLLCYWNLLCSKKQKRLAPNEGSLKTLNPIFRLPMQILSANALKPSPKPVASNPSTPKSVTPVPMPCACGR